ncbi:unnamed protein product, partial [Meganyctiphanes norvegica]
RNSDGFCNFFILITFKANCICYSIFLLKSMVLLRMIIDRRFSLKQCQVPSDDSKEGVVLYRPRRGGEGGGKLLWPPCDYPQWYFISPSLKEIGYLGALFFIDQYDWEKFFYSFSLDQIGGLLSTQEPNTYYGAGVHAYQFANFCFLVLGCCCIYSLFNVISITIKQFLNCIIKRFSCCCNRGRCASAMSARSNVVSPSRNQKHGIKRISRGDIDISAYGAETERKFSGEMVSMKEYISSNKVSLAVMQKQLYETAQMGRSSARSTSPNPRHHTPQSSERFTPGQVGPLAIATSKLCKKN